VSGWERIASGWEKIANGRHDRRPFTRHSVFYVFLLRVLSTCTRRDDQRTVTTPCDPFVVRFETLLLPRAHARHRRTAIFFGQKPSRFSTRELTRTYVFCFCFDFTTHTGRLRATSSRIIFVKQTVRCNGLLFQTNSNLSVCPRNIYLNVFVNEHDYSFANVSCVAYCPTPRHCVSGASCRFSIKNTFHK